MEINVGQGVNIDAQTVVTGRGCVIGQSGSGKSYLVGVIIEELCTLGLPFVVIDTEGEYSSLKSKFNVIWVGEDKNADIDTRIDYAKLFSESMDNGIPVVLDVSDVVDRVGLVYKALRELYAVGEEKRKPYLVIIEEADKFAPQIVHPEANMVEEISVRGRKRGIGLLVATQRPANVSKNVLAQCSYGFVGKLSIDNDVKAVTILFESKEQLSEIPNLKTGSFLPFGLENSDKIKVKQRSVLHGGSTPSLGQGTSVDTVKISKVIKDVRSSEPMPDRMASGAEGTFGARGASVREAQSVRMSDVIVSGFTEEEARAYALRGIKKQFGIFGKSVEQIDSMRSVYLPFVLCDLRLPTRKRNEYSEMSVLLKGKNLVTIDKQIELHDTGLSSPVKMSDKEGAVLKSLYLHGKADARVLERETGIPEIEVEKAILKFEKAGIVRDSNGTPIFNDCRKHSLDSKPQLEKKQVTTMETPKSETKMLADAEGMTSTLFPGSTLLSATLVYLPIYRIALRNGDRVRIFNLEALHGNRIDLPELEKVD
jgi:hypothetical protein